MVSVEFDDSLGAYFEQVVTGVTCQLSADNQGALIPLTRGPRPPSSRGKAPAPDITVTGGGARLGLPSF